MLNFTPHPITIIRPDGSSETFEPSGQIARVSTKEEDRGELNGVPVISRQLGEITGLPQNGQPCLVSALVLAACPGAKGVYAPDTGPTAIRGKEDHNRGHILAVTRLVAA